MRRGFHGASTKTKGGGENIRNLTFTRTKNGQIRKALKYKKKREGPRKVDKNLLAIPGPGCGGQIWIILCLI